MVLKELLKNPILIKAKKICLVSSIIFLSVFVLYHLIYAKSIIPGVTVAGVRLGGKTPTEAKKLLQTRLSSQDVSITFKHQDKEYIIKGSEVGLSYNINGTVEAVTSLGRSGNSLIDNKDKIASLIKGIDYNPSYTFNEDMLNNKLSLIETEVNTPLKEPRFALDDKNQLIITEYKEGFGLDRNLTTNVLRDSFIKSSSVTTQLPVKVLKPENTLANLESIKPQVEKVLNTSPNITFENNSWQLTKEELLRLIIVTKKDGKLALSIEKESLNALTAQLASVINREPHGEVFREDSGKVMEFRLKQDGVKLDEEKFKKDYINAVLKGQKDLAVSVNKTEVNSNSNKYGIYALLGEGVSYYAGSIPGRIKNLTLAAERSSGVLVPPGEVYSFNKHVGEISARTGYDQAYIISNGRTVLGEGGGVCQTSTTIFRAALNAGLPIVKRSAHAYRVSYYELNGDPGLDATIFTPSVDLVFKNDTPNYILVQAQTYPDEAKMVVRIYGTPDGREVTMEKPVVTGVTPPPAPAYQDDDSLPKGVVKQVDYSAWGATVTAKRVVKKGGEILYNDTFVSRYQPWRAVYLRGTR